MALPLIPIALASLASGGAVGTVSGFTVAGGVDGVGRAVETVTKLVIVVSLAAGAAYAYKQYQSKSQGKS